MACCEISYAIQKFDIYQDFLGHGHMHMGCTETSYTIQKLNIYMRFPLIWHAVSFSILFGIYMYIHYCGLIPHSYGLTNSV